MISKCANPICNTEFRSSREGQLFPYEIKDPEEPCRDVPAVICEKRPRHATVCFWLCEQCCAQFTLQFAVSTGVTLVPKYSEWDGDRESCAQLKAARDPEGVERRYA